MNIFIFLLKGREPSQLKKDEETKEDNSMDPLQSFLSVSNPKLSKFPRPDLSQLIPYATTSLPSSLNLSPSDPLAQFIASLPLPAQYFGVSPDVDELIKLLEETPLPPLPTEVKTEEPATKKRKKESTPPVTGPSTQLSTQEDEEEGFLKISFVCLKVFFC